MRFTEGPPAIVMGFARVPAHHADDVIARMKVSMSGQRKG
jgi:hypothetical protein